MHGLGTPAAFYGGFIAPGGNEEGGGIKIRRHWDGNLGLRVYNM